MPGRPPNTNYLTQMLTPADNMQRNQSRQFGGQPQVDSTYSSPATSSTDAQWDPQTSDPLLSQILEQVIDFVPENVSNNSEIYLLNSIDAQQNNSSAYQTREQMSEKMAITIIEKSLMQCESAVKSPSSPTISLPGTPPAYSSATVCICPSFSSKKKNAFIGNFQGYLRTFVVTNRNGYTLYLSHLNVLIQGIFA